MKLAFVVQRYGADVAGGSEGHCRDLAERLSGRHDITVLTTCAKDYVTWENAFPAGLSTENGVAVHRFRVARPRRIKVFADLSDEVFDGGAPPDRQHEWFKENGPEVPELLEYLRTQGSTFELVVFWTFRYYQSYFGLPLVVPSWYESLSIVLLEAWNHGIPALVNGRCKVLQGQVRRANGGLYYMFPAEFDEAADYLLGHPEQRAAMGRQGLAYIEREYRWPTVLSRVEALFDDVRHEANRKSKK